MLSKKAEQPMMKGVFLCMCMDFFLLPNRWTQERSAFALFSHTLILKCISVVRIDVVKFSNPINFNLWSLRLHYDFREMRKGKKSSQHSAIISNNNTIRFTHTYTKGHPGCRTTAIATLTTMRRYASLILSPFYCDYEHENFADLLSCEFSWNCRYVRTFVP